MILSTAGLVLHTTPYGEASVVAKVFTRQLGVRSYIVKGVRGPRGRVKQNLLQPLSCVDMVVYENPKNDLNYIKELSPRHPSEVSSSHSLSLPLTPSHSSIENALRFFMTEVLYKALRSEEPMPVLFDYVESTASDFRLPTSDLPISFLLTVSHHLGIEPLDNYCQHEPYFDLQEGRYVSVPAETTLSPKLSTMLHEYLSHSNFQFSVFNLSDRRSLIDALLSYFHLHLSGFHDFHSHEILHTILR
ncbi:MAG: recombination protein O N-terminal domain-containing protein [Bacteroidales bacterium]|nr:recombination protein O N-terminal domain-containing protein [Bacteroidales bacterium]